MVPFYLLFLGGILINLFAFFNFAVDIRRGGPMVEYERRIASGELVDGELSGVVLVLDQRFISWIASINAMVKSFPTSLLAHTG